MILLVFSVIRMNRFLIFFFSALWLKLCGGLLPSPLGQQMFLEILINAGCGMRSGFLIDKKFMQLVLQRYVGQFGKCETTFVSKEKM